ncbi:PREDICTED: disease resistance protein TAO1-like [Camelina sativa]|uniref:Disease resistance protein TAO1-like n=1 Tax=Camelina sativa TaxID=90675 RepID=A0ABM0YAH6_CAMSA|nr:PREDICTED: disease resistance protein TAO1-like [Camelina sativa]
MYPSSTSSTPPEKFDVFLSFRGKDTRRSFISFLYKELIRMSIRTFKDDVELKSGRRISSDLLTAIENSKIAVVVVSKNYPASPWCLRELAMIMDVEKRGSLIVMPIFYNVEPAHVRRQVEKVALQFRKHEDRENHETVVSWRQALTNLASISGHCSRDWEDDSKLLDEITKRISDMLLFSATPASDGISKEFGFGAHMKELYPLLDLDSNEGVRVIGIWARGGNGRSALARYVYQKIFKQFQSQCFLENVKEIPRDCQMSNLRDEFLIRIQGGYSKMKTSVLIKTRLMSQKVLLVANNVDKLEQLDALAEDFNCFGPGSLVIITTQDKQLLVAFGVKIVYEVECLRCFEVRQLFRQIGFRERDLYDPGSKFSESS